MDYSLIIELDNVTCDECLDLYEKKEYYTILNDGRVINFEKIKKEYNNDNNKIKKSKRKCNNSNKR